MDVPGCASLVTRQVPLENGRIRLSLRQHPELREPRGSLRLRPDGWSDPRSLLVLDGGGYAALSSICTHRGCTVDLGGPGLACPCHGSQYDREGQVTRGPASRALTRYPVRAAGDELTIEVGEVR
jgi:Rieske Fe-S protein